MNLTDLLHETLEPIGDDPLTAEQTSALIDQLLTDEERRKTYETTRELDFSTAIEGMARSPVDLFHQRGSRAAVMRMIPVDVPALEDLKMPEIVRKLAMKPRGLVLVTGPTGSGPTGSGKSTTLAAMIDFINRTEHGHILTLEDPIEFMHRDKQCYVNQREIGSDSLSFTNALRGALREDPDIILVGEMRDLETIGLAITAAETGHRNRPPRLWNSSYNERHSDRGPRRRRVPPRGSATGANAAGQHASGRPFPNTSAEDWRRPLLCSGDHDRNRRGAKLYTRRENTTTSQPASDWGQYGMHTLEAALERLVLEKKVTPEDAVGKANSPVSLIQTLHRAGMDDFEAFRKNRKK